MKSMLYQAILQPQTNLQLHQLPLHIPLPLLTTKIHPSITNQLLSSTQNLKQSTTEGVNVHLSIKLLLLVNLRSLVVISTTITVTLRIVSITHLRYPEIYQKHRTLIVFLKIHQIGRLKITMNYTHTHLPLLPRLLRLVILQHLVVQIVQYLSTTQRKN